MPRIAPQSVIGFFIRAANGQNLGVDFYLFIPSYYFAAK
jgi:hypothetical protein